MVKQKTAVLLVNLGSPSAPTTSAVRRFLKEFLWDPRVVNLPRVLWWLILHGLVLTIRPRKSAQAYRKIWTDEGSPLVVYTQKLASQIAKEFPDLSVFAAMRYGEPAISKQLDKIKTSSIDQLIILPLYPQYSSTTTASIHDEVIKNLKGWFHLPSIYFISDYHQQQGYIDAIAKSITEHWQNHGRNQFLLMSFHGLPERLTTLGDPYFHQCQKTAEKIAETLGLTTNQWQLVFQSRFGKAEWLKPYCVDTLQNLPAQGIHSIDIICPGFAVDCLETLEEIAIENKKIFLAAGGKQYSYIPALNDSDLQIKAISPLIEQQH